MCQRQYFSVIARSREMQLSYYGNLMMDYPSPLDRPGTSSYMCLINTSCTHLWVRCLARHRGHQDEQSWPSRPETAYRHRVDCTCIITHCYKCFEAKEQDHGDSDRWGDVAPQAGRCCSHAEGGRVGWGGGTWTWISEIFWKWNQEHGKQAGRGDRGRKWYKPILVL